MSILGNLFGSNNISNENEQILRWVVDVLKVIEKAGPALNINSCTVQVMAGNNVQIQIQDWHDDFISRFGTEHGLEKFFELVPASGTSDIYITKITPHISGSPKKFINNLEQELKENQIIGYQRDNRFNCLQKNFRD